MGPAEDQVYEFGPYRIDRTERLLHRGEELIALPPKAVGTLLVLVESAGRMVERGDLMKAVWPDTFVEEGALTRNISLLRKALGDVGAEPLYIETIPKRGYRFVAPVLPVTAPPIPPLRGPTGRPRRSLPGRNRRRSLRSRSPGIPPCGAWSWPGWFCWPPAWR